MTLIKDYTAEDLQNAFDKGRATGRAERDWVGLTDEEILDTLGISGSADADYNAVRTLNDARKLEAKLKEKNHGT
jgi:hypothetical protein